MRKLFWKRRLLGTYVGGGEKAGVIGHNGHFCAVVARLIEDPLLELYEYVRTLFISGIQVSIMVFWLWSRAIDPCANLSPIVSKK